jgi:hypothetical protein
MQQISDYERSTSIAKDRKYWLSLYCQCYKATKGYALEDILVAD